MIMILWLLCICQSCSKVSSLFVFFLWFCGYWSCVTDSQLHFLTHSFKRMRNTKCRDGRPSYLIGNSLMQIWISQTGCFKDFQRSAFREFVIGELQQLPVLWFSAWKAIVIVILSDKWPFISFRNLYAFCPKNWQLAFVWKEWIIKSPQLVLNVSLSEV